MNEMKKASKPCVRPLVTGASGTVLAAALLLATTAAHAQDNAKPDTPATQKAAKSRAAIPRIGFKGMQISRSQPAILASGAPAEVAADGSGGQCQPVRLDRSRLVDFMALSAKRADMRYRSTQIGIENAYIEWMEGQGHKVNAVVLADRAGKKQALPTGGQSVAATTAKNAR